MNNNSPTLTIPRTPRTRAASSSGNERLAIATSIVQIARINTHSKNEPS